MYSLTTFLSVLLGSLTFVLAQSACSGPEVTVNLRVEGYWNTFFEGPITTCGHDVTTSSGGTHRCDGTNGEAQLTPGPTVTGALDTAATLWNFTWDGTYVKKEDDFNVTTIDGHKYVWSPFVNWNFVSINGCQVQVKNGDDILWIQLRPDMNSVLKLDGPNTVIANEPFQLSVTDVFRGNPVEGATVYNHGTSDKDGHITMTLADQGIYKLKAEKAGAIRSNAAWIQVLPQEEKTKEEPAKAETVVEPQEDKPKEEPTKVETVVEEDKPKEAPAKAETVVEPQEDKPKEEPAKVETVVEAQEDKPKEEAIHAETVVKQKPVTEHIKEEL